jgi:UDP-N-acetylglucosamine 2-epimerase (non-hydrolysing)
MPESKTRLMFVFGTRPEAVKMAPVILEARQRDEFEVCVALTAQHREMLDSVLSLFGIQGDYDLDIMSEGQTLERITQRALEGLSPVIEQEKPDWVLVQGDTTTTFVAALCAFYQRVPVAHIEAGLRTSDIYEPFPEEVNRRLTTTLATLHFPPTPQARHNLLNEGVDDSHMTVTGNTVVDALMHIQQTPYIPTGEIERAMDRLGDRRLITVTAHRRENLGPRLEGICEALKTLAADRPDLGFVFPVHPNPAVRKTVHGVLEGLDGIELTEPLGYREMVFLMEKSHLLLTDSGGLQEEGMALGVPVLVMREKTERPELIDSGGGFLVGTDPGRIVPAVIELCDNELKREKISRAGNPFGRGEASKVILNYLLGETSPPVLFEPSNSG